MGLERGTVGRKAFFDTKNPRISPRADGSFVVGVSSPLESEHQLLPVWPKIGKLLLSSDCLPEEKASTNKEHKT